MIDAAMDSLIARLAREMHTDIIRGLCRAKLSESFTTSEFEIASKAYWSTYGVDVPPMNNVTVKALLRKFNVVAEVEPDLWALRY